MIQRLIDARRLVFIDETWIKTNMTRTHGWGQKGEPLIDKVPHGHWKTLTFLAALTHKGIAAPCVLDGPINGESFMAWVEQFLIPELEPGAIVVLDNLGSHKADRIRQALRKAGASCSTCRPTRPTSIRSSRSSQSSSGCSERPKSGASRPAGDASAPCSTTSRLRNAPTISAGPTMRSSKPERL